MQTLTLEQHQIDEFRTFIWNFYTLAQRDFVWRYAQDPYWVLVSEIMLQQTQTHRVKDKFVQFIERFPTIESLAQASWPDVLGAWQGLGYNSRAKRLRQTAQRLYYEFNATVPQDCKILETLPGIGLATAGAIATFAFNQPNIFIETNIRTVFIYHFFPGYTSVHDKEIEHLVRQTLDHNDPRSWYYALMDYGVHIKQHVCNPSRSSAHYTRQSKFEGSDRQIRSSILKILLSTKIMPEQDLIIMIGRDESRVENIIQQLCAEQLIIKNGTTLSLM